MNLPELQAAIYEAGFDAFAIMPALPVQTMLPILREAQVENRYPDFVDPDIAKRIDPKNLQKNAKSVISLAMSYNVGDGGPTSPLHGTISRSAWGIDYHRVLGNGMDKVIDYLRNSCGAKECTRTVDTSFLLDRGLAVEAGLGYPGSNCAVYVPPYGSWVFLGEILTDLELRPTKAEKQDNWSCPVNCDRCLRACPTQALFAPGKIRPGRCISYLTQMPGPIPHGLREKIGSRLWGCDTCQEVCPINQRAKFTSHPEFQPVLGRQIPLLPLLGLSKRQFVEQFGKTSMAWRGKNVLQRNAAIILGNQRNRDALPSLEKTAREHPSTAVQDAASWAVRTIKGT
ncbi:MAG TPA: tRNA epoxyqueuosine(34) reductase QueG [Firmicutes bacterium]|nr:tRNA epoxyqueuosine(34) reductase QueG [Bacillota bacterium]